MNFKKMMALSLCGALALSVAACSSKPAAAPAASSEAQSTAEKTVDDFANVDLEAICNVNAISALAENGQQVKSDYEYTNPDGTSGGKYSSYFVLNDAGAFSCYEGEESFGDGTQADYASYTTPEVRFESYTYADGTVKYLLTPFTNYQGVTYNITYDVDEQVTDRAYADGVFTLTTSEAADADMVEFYPDVTIETKEYDYHVDGETLQLLGYEKYAVEGDGTRHLYMTLKNTFGVTTVPEVPALFTDYITTPPAEGRRTVTFKYLDGSADQSYQLPDTWSSNAYLFPNPSYDFTLYADEACTTLLTSIEPDANGVYPDMTVYVKADE